MKTLVIICMLLSLLQVAISVATKDNRLAAWALIALIWQFNYLIRIQND